MMGSSWVDGVLEGRTEAGCERMVGDLRDVVHFTE